MQRYKDTKMQKETDTLRGTLGKVKNHKDIWREKEDDCFW